MFEGFKTESIIKRAIDKHLVEINIIDIKTLQSAIMEFVFKDVEKIL